MRIIAYAISTLIVVLAVAPAMGATYCVDTATGFQNALSAAAASNADDLIRLELGTYVSSSAQGFRAELTTTGDLEISGGWANGCVFRSRGQRSTIDGELARPALVLIGSFSSDGLLRVSYLNVLRGVSNDSQLAGGLTANPLLGSSLDIEIESNRFSGNIANSNTGAFGGGLKAVADRSMLIRNNVFLDNDARMGGGAADLYCNTDIAGLVNNTVVGNSADVGASSDIGGVYLGGVGCIWEVANNILWDNEGIDLALFMSDTVLRRNNLEDLGGLYPPGSSSGNVNVNPRFGGVNNFRLRRDSPMVDAGLDDPITGLPLSSHDGGPRVAGPHVDIGAYELDVLFADDFDLLVIGAVEP